MWGYDRERCVTGVLAGLAMLVCFAREAAPEAGREATDAPLVRLASPFDQEVASRAVRRAARLLERPACRQLLAEFRDGQGRPLQAALDGLGLTPDAYLRDYVLFYDGSGQRGCMDRRTLACTVPESRVVYLCPRFLRRELERPAHTQVLVIHEMLHTLGLGEDPPSSQEITESVRLACAP